MVLLHGAGDSTVTLTLVAAPVQDLAAGDAFVVTAGCDKSRETCRDKFANVRRFRGFADVPPEGTVLRVAKRGGANQGRVL